MFIEILSGGAATPELLFLILLGIYLVKESRRRGLHPFDWFSLPPSMNFVVAVMVFDVGVYVRSVALLLGAGQSAAMVFGSALLIIGSLCKIRAWTEPDQGRLPWLTAIASTAVAMMFLVFYW